MGSHTQCQQIGILGHAYTVEAKGKDVVVSGPGPVAGLLQQPPLARDPVEAELRDVLHVLPPLDDHLVHHVRV